MAKQPIRVVAAEYLKDYEVCIRFSDGSQKSVDFERWLSGEVFRPLVDKRMFRRFFIAGGTVCWPNGADIAPETLYAAKDARTTAA